MKGNSKETSFRNLILCISETVSALNFIGCIIVSNNNTFKPLLHFLLFIKNPMHASAEFGHVYPHYPLLSHPSHNNSSFISMFHPSLISFIFPY